MADVTKINTIALDLVFVALRMDDSQEDVPESTHLLSEVHSRTCVSPRLVLIIFTLLNFVIYFDRGAIAGALSSIRVDAYIADGKAAISDAAAGFLVSGFTVGYMITCPLFALGGNTLGSRNVILLGMTLWCLSCLGCAAAPNFPLLLLCRTLAGVAEAAFVGFTVTIVDNIAPPRRRTLWIGIFYAMIPVGTAVGISGAGVATTMPSICGLVSWRAVFLVEVVAAMPLVFMLVLVPARYHIRGRDRTEAVGLVKATTTLLCNINYILVVLGFAAYCFVTGAITTWGIPLLVDGPLELSRGTASIMMGLTTTIGGVVGSLLGGVSLDWMGGSIGIRGAFHCQLFNIIMIACGAPSGISALLVKDILSFVVFFQLAVVALFAITAPVNASILTVVSPDLRPYAISYSVFFIHLLGDFSSPTITGLLSDHMGRHCRTLSHQDCLRASLSKQCTWIESTNSSGRCVNPVQLRNALLLVFSYVLFAIPCWTIVMWRLRRSLGEPGTVAPDQEPEAPSSPPHDCPPSQSSSVLQQTTTHTVEAL